MACFQACCILGLSAANARMLQAVLVALLEEHLYAGEHEQGSDDMYPAFLVVLTSSIGLAATRHLSAHMGRIGPFACWALYCIHGSKLAMLLLPEVSCVSTPPLFGAFPA